MIKIFIQTEDGKEKELHEMKSNPLPCVPRKDDWVQIGQNNFIVRYVTYNYDGIPYIKIALGEYGRGYKK